MPAAPSAASQHTGHTDESLYVQGSFKPGQAGGTPRASMQYPAVAPCWEKNAPHPQSSLLLSLHMRRPFLSCPTTPPLLVPPFCFLCLGVSFYLLCLFALLMGTQAASRAWLLYITLQWTQGHILLQISARTSPGKYPKVGSLGQKAVLFLIF